MDTIQIAQTQINGMQGKRYQPETKIHANWFGNYKPEPEKEVKEHKTKETKKSKKAIEDLKTAFEKYLPEALERTEWKLRGVGDDYRAALETLRGLKYNSKNVTDFSIVLGAFENDKNFYKIPGPFFSAVAKHCEDKEFVIITKHFHEPLDGFGSFNTKTIIVEGNVGGGLGEWMKGGTITVEGNAGGWVGENMKGGKIIVTGNAGAEIGYNMEGGSIYLKGKFRGISEEISGGNIYHKGKLIVKDGKVLI